ncbi:MAG TPA: SDR family oxidoreductase [Myxococcales bacterium]|nr:SDR family oxidoreductase [Myxococcales bacterium]
MDLQLKGKKALVTGSTAGIGLAIARELAAEGAQVVVNGRTQKRVDEALKSVPGGAGVAADMGSAEGVARVIAAHPDLDILVNNVGIFAAKPYDQIPDAEWMQFFETNVLSGVRLSRHHLPRMVKRGFGRVLFISSESALQIPAEMIHYGMTKTAQLAVARGLAESVAGTGVTVNSVLPGPTRSEGVGQFVESVAAQRGVTTAQMEKEFFQHMRPSSLLKRFETVEEIAHMVTYLSSPLASGTTGSAVRVDGGVVRAI